MCNRNTSTTSKIVKQKLLENKVDSLIDCCLISANLVVFHKIKLTTNKSCMLKEEFEDTKGVIRICNSAKDG